ncbi:hypothetical protein C0992_003392 [Termitomyces sp. T32_za158]|nr:hypothetical protein C0992_003392 [Termitomyces sp. T32_za158]
MSLENPIGRTPMLTNDLNPAMFSEKLRNMTSGVFPQCQERPFPAKCLRDRDEESFDDHRYPARLVNNFGKLYPNPCHKSFNRVEMTDERLGALSEQAHRQTTDLSLTVNLCNIWATRNHPNPKIKVSEFAIYGDEESCSFSAVAIYQIWTWLVSILDHESLRAIYVDADAHSVLRFLKTVSHSPQISSRLECLELITYEKFKWDEAFACLNQCTALRRLRIVGDKPPQSLAFNESVQLQCRLLAYDGPVELILCLFNSYETLVSLSLTARSEGELADYYIMDKLKMYQDKLPLHKIRFLRVYVGKLLLAPLLRKVGILFGNLEALQVSTRLSPFGSLPIRPADLELFKGALTWNRPLSFKYLDIEGLLCSDRHQLLRMGFRSLRCPVVRLSEVTTDDRVKEIWLSEPTTDDKGRYLGQ